MNYLKLGNVWGRVTEVKELKSRKGQRKPYLFLTIDCGNERLGQVRTFGRIWGEKRIADFQSVYKAHSAEIIRFTGFFSQYDDEEGKRNSNYTFLKWQPVKDKEMKAAFVLKGLVHSKSSDSEIVRLSVVNEASGDYEETEEVFDIYIHPQTAFEGYNSFAGFEEIEAGHYIEVSGYIRTKEPEDEFGMTSSDIKPYAMRIKKLNTASKEEPPL